MVSVVPKPLLWTRTVGRPKTLTFPEPLFDRDPVVFVGGKALADPGVVATIPMAPRPRVKVTNRQRITSLRDRLIWFSSCDGWRPLRHNGTIRFRQWARFTLDTT